MLNKKDVYNMLKISLERCLLVRNDSRKVIMFFRFRSNKVYNKKHRARNRQLYIYNWDCI